MLIAQLGAVVAPAVVSPLTRLPLAAGPTVDFDRTVLVQAALFLFLMWVLKPLLFDPLLKVFEERDRRTDGTRAEARALEERAGELYLRYQRQHEQALRLVGEERDRLRSATTKLETQILADARKQALQVVEQGRQAVAREAATLKQELVQRSGVLAKDVASAALGREVQ